ncbi:MAG: recombinase family protein [Oscillospiraceae bacterium]|jgi:DNA invertase Pin-like site-specific DNA recombinase|nr:recombinase family protein [Oscillospiraceae bacterium]
MQSQLGKAAIYCRTALADTEELDNQEQAARELVKSYGYTNIICYRDNAASGTTIDRPEMNRLRADIQAEDIDIVVIRDISRIARTPALVLQFVLELDEYNVQLTTVNGDRSKDLANVFRQYING